MQSPGSGFWPKPDPHPWFKPDLFFSIRIQFRPKHWKLRIFRYIYNLPEDGWEGQFGGIHSRALLYPVVDLDPAHLLQCPRFTKNKSDLLMMNTFLNQIVIVSRPLDPDFVWDFSDTDLDFSNWSDPG